MLIAVIGGKLQGVEAVYLAKKACWQTLLIDKNPDPPAAGICDDFIRFEIRHDQPFPPDCQQIDLIMPAIEDSKVLSILWDWSRANGIPMAFDPDAYKISNSKTASDTVFQRLKLPFPMPWPGCRFPVLVKPDQSSGSHGVDVFENPETLDTRLQAQMPGDKLVAQEYIDGPSYSIEVIGRPGAFHALQVTDLGMDEDWDCNRVSAPASLSPDFAFRFKQMALLIAGEIQLNGIMDFEAILDNDQLKLLEIDARLPSQTPMAVYWSTGLNMVQLLGQLFLDQDLQPCAGEERPVWIEHVRAAGSTLEFPGEHIMALDGALKVQKPFFGADEAITSFTPEKHQWVATLIFHGTSRSEMVQKRRVCHALIRAYINKRERNL